MKYFIPTISFLLAFNFCLAQGKGTHKFKPGDKISENIIHFTDSVSMRMYTLPNKAFTLLYRFNTINGVNDNYDSLKKVVSHVYRLNRYFGPNKKPSRLTCVIFVKEVNADARALKEQIKRWNKQIGDSLVKTDRAGFNFSRVWETLFIKDTIHIKSTSILAAGKMSVISEEGVLLSTSAMSTFKFGELKNSIKGKLLTDKEGKKTPLANVRVSLFKTGTEEPDSALTNVYGDFELTVPDEKTDYSIVVKSQPKDKNNEDVTNIILATQTGQEISRLKKTSRGFEYKMIPTDVILLKEMADEDDIVMKFTKFGGSKKNDLMVTESILYELGQYNLEESSYEILDKVVKIMNENSIVTLEVISHTDAQGDDKANMTLSEKRSTSVISYFISKGIHKSRLKGIGKGESEIRNRCTNGVDCSDKEHGYNRRTEFKFTKS